MIFTFSDFSIISAFISIEDGTLISISDVQALNAHFPISITEEGIVICLMLVHSQKQYSSIFFTDEGIDTSIKDEHLLNACLPRNSTEEGIDI